MSEYQTMTVLAAFAFAYSLLASRLDRTPVRGALVYTVAGSICGPLGLGMVGLNLDETSIRLLAELTLAIVLFTDAATANLKVLRQFETIPLRLLAIGLPLTILTGYGAAKLLFPEIPAVELALLAVALAPTDAALGKPVVVDRRVPESTRESLNVESGLNDGICVPALLFFLTVANGLSNGQEPWSLAAGLALKVIGLGAMVGIVLGLFGCGLLKISAHRQWTTGSWKEIPVLTLAILCFAAAEWLGGSGFIGAFVGGLVFNATARNEREEFLDAADGTSDALALLTWFAFGTMLFQPPFAESNWRCWVYAVASLTIVRMLPVALALSGLNMKWDTKAIMGWFGPRGLASIVFVTMIYEQLGDRSSTITATAACTILLSVLLHGTTAGPLVTWYRSRLRNRGEAAGEDDDIPPEPNPRPGKEHAADSSSM
ncbi:MAG: cation:proton antiporter [Rubinisphaera brasiliensis]|uniref:cation:proton antiporter n=1 Tax=Rubinisphaera brasiliensis TaxID=119 RepID=UPI00391CAAF7